MGCSSATSSTTDTYNSNTTPEQAAEIYKGLTLSLDGVEYVSPSGNPKHLFQTYYLDVPVEDYVTDLWVQQIQSYGAMRGKSKLQFSGRIIQLDYVSDHVTGESNQNVHQVQDPSFVDVAPNEQPRDISGFRGSPTSVTMRETTQSQAYLTISMEFKIVDNRNSEVVFQGEFSQQYNIIHSPKEDFDGLVIACIDQFLTYPKVLEICKEFEHTFTSP